MKVDLSDAPEYLRIRHNKKAGLPALFAWVMGVCIPLVALHIGGQAFLQGTVKNLATQQQNSAPVAEISRPTEEIITNQDWEKIVEEKSQRDAMTQPQAAKTVVNPTKQSVFNDHNYTPRGADNVLSLNETYQPEEPKPAPQGVRVTIVNETKDSTCWPLKEGSIERRNCKFATGLNRN